MVGRERLSEEVMLKLKSEGSLQVSQAKGMRTNIADGGGGMCKSPEEGGYEAEELKGIPT